MPEKPNSYDIVEEAVYKLWKKEGYAQDAVAFFYQKYDSEYDKEWEWCEELILAPSCGLGTCVEFWHDFCEGQTLVKDLTVVTLDELTSFYAKQHKLGEYKGDVKDDDQLSELRSTD